MLSFSNHKHCLLSFDRLQDYDESSARQVNILNIILYKVYLFRNGYRIPMI